MLNTWIVVADSSIARFFVLESRTAPLKELESMPHPAGRLREQDEVSDRQGGIAGGHGQGDHTFEAPTDLKHHEAVVFAKHIAAELEQGRIEHVYDDIILIAPPAFLGVLRQELNDHVSKLVTASLDKHLTTEEEPLIRQYVLEIA